MAIFGRTIRGAHTVPSRRIHCGEQPTRVAAMAFTKAKSTTALVGKVGYLALFHMDHLGGTLSPIRPIRYGIRTRT